MPPPVLSTHGPPCAWAAVVAAAANAALVRRAFFSRGPFGKHHLSPSSLIERCLLFRTANPVARFAAGQAAQTTVWSGARATCTLQGNVDINVVVLVSFVQI
ncbi:hypothetical protein BU15DRAFT_75741 [Melanogaster broomeanus]|nr:hypothetical protein BU15DRAFT_75741 [Melanogaster broomeanus]